MSQHYRVTSAGIPPNTNHFLKFLVVRHPLDRLYSAYMNKFSWQADGSLPQFAKTSMKIHREQTKDKGIVVLKTEKEEFFHQNNAKPVQFLTIINF